jgi:hypothetical protein
MKASNSAMSSFLITKNTEDDNEGDLLKTRERRLRVRFRARSQAPSHRVNTIVLVRLEAQ